MSLSVQTHRTATAGEWDEAWQGCDYATYFHSREWAELWSRYTERRLRPAPVRLDFSDGKRLILPLTECVGRFGLLRGWESSPAGTFGGWISTDDLTAGHVSPTVSWMLRERPDLVWRINPFFEPAGYVDGLDAQPDVTHVLSLEEGYEAIAAGWARGRGGVARKIRKAERVGILVREGRSEADWAGYVRCYEASLSRWGEEATSRYSSRLFEILRELRSPGVRLWLALHRDEIVAGALCLYARSHVVYWHGAALAEHFDKRPVNLLMATIIRHACENGARWFDFNPSGGHAGVESFKSSFGARPLECPVVVRRTTGHRALRLLRLAGRSIR